MDDLDALLEDVPDPVVQKKPTTVGKKKPKVEDDDDGWGMDLEDKKETAGFGMNSSRDSNRPSFGYGGAHGLKKEAIKKEEEDEWNLDEPAQKTGGFGGRLLGRKPKKEEPDDDLDNFLDDLEAKRGINSKPAPVEEKK